jgi:c-di-AMP phosphodiesterase-like protein
MWKLFVSLFSLLASAVSVYFFIYFHETNEIASLIFLIAAFALMIICVVFFMMFINRNNAAKIESLNTRLKLWSNVSYHVTQAGDEVFNELPIGVLVYDENYIIKWANEYSKKVFNSTLVELSLSVISETLLKGVIAGNNTMLLNFSDRNYDVVHNTENNVLYFFYVTKREAIIKRYDERLPVIGVIGLDNLEESLKRYDVQEKNTIRGEILGEISDWVGSFGCSLQVLSNDRMIIISDKESLQRMIDDKFSILSKVRDISSKNRLKSSISMGIACYDIEHNEIGSLAQNAIDLAEKRGGDQVVVNIQGQNIQ